MRFSKVTASNVLWNVRGVTLDATIVIWQTFEFEFLLWLQTRRQKALNIRWRRTRQPPAYNQNGAFSAARDEGRKREQVSLISVLSLENFAITQLRSSSPLLRLLSSLPLSVINLSLFGDYSGRSFWYSLSWFTETDVSFSCSCSWVLVSWVR